MISIGYTDKITKFRVHVLQLCLIIICLIISIAQFASKARTTRSHTWFFAVVNVPESIDTQGALLFSVPNSAPLASFRITLG